MSLRERMSSSRVSMSFSSCSTLSFSVLMSEWNLLTRTCKSYSSKMWFQWRQVRYWNMRRMRFVLRLVHLCLYICETKEADKCTTEIISGRIIVYCLCLCVCIVCKGQIPNNPMALSRVICGGYGTLMCYLGVCHSLLQLFQPVLRGGAGSGIAQLSLDLYQVII